jgi:hypothetical protein
MLCSLGVVGDARAMSKAHRAEGKTLKPMDDGRSSRMSGARMMGEIHKTQSEERNENSE